MRKLGLKKFWRFIEVSTTIYNDIEGTLSEDEMESAAGEMAQSNVIANPDQVSEAAETSGRKKTTLSDRVTSEILMQVRLRKFENAKPVGWQYQGVDASNSAQELMEGQLRQKQPTQSDHVTSEILLQSIRRTYDLLLEDVFSKLTRTLSSQEKQEISTVLYQNIDEKWHDLGRFSRRDTAGMPINPEDANWIDWFTSGMGPRS